MSKHNNLDGLTEQLSKAGIGGAYSADFMLPFVLFGLVWSGFW